MLPRLTHTSTALGRPQRVSASTSSHSSSHLQSPLLAQFASSSSTYPRASQHHQCQHTLVMRCAGDHAAILSTTVSPESQLQGRLELPPFQPLAGPAPEGYRPNVGVCLVQRSTGLVFAAQRVDDPSGCWQMPQGGIDAGEDPLEAAIRELREETSVKSVVPLATISAWLPYEMPTSVRCRLHGSMARWVGQAQRWYLLEFTGSDTEVNLDTEEREFSTWAWRPLHELPGSVVQFKKAVYTHVADQFGPYIERLKPGAQDVLNNQALVKGGT